MDLSTLGGGGGVVLGSVVPIASAGVHYIAADSTEYLMTGNIDDNVAAYPDTPAQLQFTDFFGTKLIQGPRTIRSSDAYPYIIIQTYPGHASILLFDKDFNETGRQGTGMPEGSILRGICVSGTNYYALNDKQNITKSVGSFITAATQKSIMAQCVNPTDIASDNNKVYVLDATTKSIYIYDENLNYTGQSWAINTNGLNITPSCINVYGDSLYVYDSTSKCIYTFPKTGGVPTSKTVPVSDYVGHLYGFIIDATQGPVVLSAYPSATWSGIGRINPAVGQPQKMFVKSGNRYDGLNQTGISESTVVPYYVRIK